MKRKERCAIKCDSNMQIAIREIAQTPNLFPGLFPKGMESHTITDVITVSIAMYLQNILKGRISQKQIDSAASEKDIAKLFIMWARAERGIEGYGFTTKNPKTRFVYGNGADIVRTVGDLEK